MTDGSAAAPKKAAKPPAAPRRNVWREPVTAVANYLFCFGLLPNLPFWLLAKREGIANPGWFSLDGLWLGVAALFVRPRWVFALFVVDFLLDVADAIRISYSTGFTDVFESLHYLFTAVAPAQMAFTAIIIVLVLGLIAMAWVRLRPQVSGPARKWLALALVAVLALWTVASRLGGLVPGSARSPAADFTQAWIHEGMWETLNGRGVHAMVPAASATDQVRQLLVGPGLETNLVVVLVESWGEATEPSLRQALVEPFATPEISRRYATRRGLVNFNGATQEGELRELCDQRPAEAGGRPSIASVDLPNCLPFQMQRAGFRTVALDSAAAYWVGGRNWYSTIGFERTVGFESLHQMGLPTFTAGPFRSIRDADVAGQIPHLLAADTSKPTFLFFLTVSAHLPINLPLPDGYDSDCGIAAATRDSPQACGWYRIERQTMAGIAGAAAAPGLPSTIFVIVGDHAPPFADDARLAFLQTQVPYLILTPH